MLRIRPFAVARLVVCATIVGAALAGCSSSGSSFSDMFKPSPPPPQVMRFDSVPPGANVQTAQGQTCSTPCALALPMNSQAVAFSLNGYVPQSIQLSVQQPEGSLFSTPPPNLVPNPVVAQLQVLPPAPRKEAKPKPRKMVARPKPAAPRSAAPRPAMTTGPTQPSIAAPEQQPAQDNVFPPPPPPNSPSPFPPPPQPR
jgi:hypothetical protein